MASSVPAHCQLVAGLAGEEHEGRHAGREDAHHSPAARDVDDGHTKS